MTKATSKSIRSASARTSVTPIGNKTTTPAKSRPLRPPRKAIEVVPLQVPAPVATSKQGQLATLLLCDQGATLDQMIALTGWLPHTTRAALTGLRKKGYAIDSDKADGVRTYRAVAPQ